MNTRYHHGDLRRAVLEQAAEVIGRDGIASLSLRSIADDLGVSHTAPMHHFGSREGVLNALAVEGFELLQQRPGDRGPARLPRGRASLTWSSPSATPATSR